MNLCNQTNSETSQQDDRRATGVSSIAKRAEHTERVSIEARERGGSGAQGASVPAGIGDEQDHAVLTAITQLQPKPSLDRLDVVDDRFRLGRPPPRLSSEHRIPRPEVAGDRKRHFVGDRDGSVEPNAKSMEKPLLTGVPDRVARKMCLQANIEADRRADRGELDVRRHSGP